MISTKLKLSPKELRLVRDAGFILTKNAILDKVKYLLQELSEKQVSYIRQEMDSFPLELFRHPPKISRGENYRGLPWLVLDYPRVFENEKHPSGKAGIVAIRTLFWWGRYCSVTLHLQGFYKKIYRRQVADAYPLLKQKNFFVCINSLQWEHHAGKDNYRSLKKMDKPSFEKITGEKDFLKLTATCKLDNWNAGLTENLMAKYILLVGLLKSDQLPSR
jgi:hypothetical protein